MEYIYIHGLNSGITSRSASLLEQLIERPLLRISNDYSKHYSYCLINIENQILAHFSNPSDLCILGTSLGGFYALSLRISGIKKVIAWNPVIYPSVQLGKFIGENTRFTDGKRWDFSYETCISYAEAADPRQWHNFSLAAKYGGHPAPPVPLRTIFFGTHDEVLDSRLGKAYWQTHAKIEDIDSGHSIEDFTHSLHYLK